MCNMFRLLTAGEIECRVAQTGKGQKGPWCQILIYKDARVDQKLLDEVIGPMNWKNSYEFINGSLYCTVSVWDKDKKEWISKQNVGTESNTEKEKGQASDAFKRACFNLGIGRELYTAPKDVYISLNDGEYREKDGKIYVNTRFDVSEIEYNKDRQITKLVIVDKYGKIRYSMGAKQSGNQSAANRAEKPTFTGKKGEKMAEDSPVWVKFAQRVANGETTKDGGSLAKMVEDYYSLPKDAMKRFLALVTKIQTNAA